MPKPYYDKRITPEQALAWLKERRDSSSWSRNKEMFSAVIEMLSGPPVEERPNCDGSVDEVIAKNVNFHLEQMDQTAYWIGIDRANGLDYSIRFGVKDGSFYLTTEDDSEVPC